jgi:heptaprenyl diphosphate synthase
VNTGKAVLKLTQLQNKYQIALLSAFAIGIHSIENLLPSPIPWLRFGFANIITLIALYIYGFRAAFTVTLIRTFISSLINGTFPGPAYLMSLGGGIAATISMWLIIYLIPHLFSAVGISVIGAFFHNTIQIFIAYLLLIQCLEPVILVSPLIILAGTIAGTINGIVAEFVIANLKNQLKPT